MHDRQGLNWHGYNLYLGKQRDRVVAMVEPNPHWPGMWHAQLVGSGDSSDMASLSRAKDAAVVLALRKLNRLLPPLSQRAA